MGGNLSHLGLSPAQERVAQAIPVLAKEVVSQGRGRIVFVTGQSGSGASHLLHAMRRLDKFGFRVASGRLTEPQSVDQEPEWMRRIETLVTSAFSVASALDPSLSLVASIAGFSAAAAGTLRTAQQSAVEPTELVMRVLRAAAREAPDRPLVCLIDDAIWLSGDWWTELQFSFAREIVEGLPLVLLLAVEEIPILKGPNEDPPSSRVARSLLERGLADSVSLEALTSNELNSWLGLSSRSATKGVMELTQGRTGEVAELWRAWLAHGVLESTEGGWRLRDADAISDDAVAELAARLERLRRDRDRTEEDLLREALALGALEGRVFTATAVAQALNRDRDTVEDLLDELVAEPPETGILRPPRAIEVQDLPHDSSRVLWRYEFSNSLLWRAARDRLSDLPVKVAATRMLNAVVDSFGNEIPLILPSLTRLADLAGDQNESARYRSLVNDPSVAALAAQADRLLTIDNSDWVAADYRDAANLLSKAAMELRDRRDMCALLTLTQQAADHARAAGEIGSRALALALSTEGFLFSHIGELDPAEAKLEEARAIVQQGAPNLLATILRQLAEVTRDRYGSFEDQRALLKKSLRLFQREKNRLGEATVQYNLAGIAAREEDLVLARSLNGEALAGMRGAGDREQEMFAIQQRANIELKTGNLDLARELVEQVLRHRLTQGDKYREAGCRLMLSRIELESGNLERAWNSGEAALAVYRNGNDGAAEARTLHVLGDTALALGKGGIGGELLREAQLTLRRLGDMKQLLEVEGKLRSNLQRIG